MGEKSKSLISTEETYIIQSYVFTTARFKYSVAEKRIVYRILEALQGELNGVRLNYDATFQDDLFDESKKISFPVSILGVTDSKNQKVVRKALESLRKKSIEYEYRNEKGKRVIRGTGIIENWEFAPFSRTVSVKIDKGVYTAFKAFAKGFRKFKLETAFSFESVYTMRFFELFSGQTKPLTYSIESLRTMFKLDGKYKLTADFIRRVILPAKKELDEKSPYSFTYKTSGKGRKIESITFYVYLTENENKEESTPLENNLSVIHELPYHVLGQLSNYGFNSREIKKNIGLLKWAYEDIDLILFLSQKKKYIKNSERPVGYIIGMLRNEKKKVSQRKRSE